MLIFNIITIFPQIFDFYFSESIIKRAQKKKIIKINIHNLRDFSVDKHQSIDDRPYGGESGMVFKVEPIFRAVKKIIQTKKISPKKRKIVLFTPRGKKFNQKIAYSFASLEQLIFICGRYEGVDERVAKYIADIELSIGDYDLMGGEIPAMAVIETVTRLIPGVLGNSQLLKQRITKEKGFIEYPQYTRPPKFYPKGKLRPTSPEVWRVPKILLSGDHKKIEEWRKKYQKII